MCGRVIQSSEPLRLAIVDGLDVSDSRMGNVRPALHPKGDILSVKVDVCYVPEADISHIVATFDCCHSEEVIVCLNQ